MAARAITITLPVLEFPCALRNTSGYNGIRLVCDWSFLNKCCSGITSSSILFFIMNFLPASYFANTIAHIKFILITSFSWLYACPASEWIADARVYKLAFLDSNPWEDTLPVIKAWGRRTLSLRGWVRCTQLDIVSLPKVKINASSVLEFTYYAHWSNWVWEENTSALKYLWTSNMSQKCS